MVYYPILVSEMAKREIQKKKLAQCVGICDKALRNKMDGKTPFTLPEAKEIRRSFFPDISLEELFATADEREGA